MLAPTSKGSALRGFVFDKYCPSFFLVFVFFVVFEHEEQYLGSSSGGSAAEQAKIKER